MKVLGLIAASLIAICSLAACGGGSSATPTAPPARTVVAGVATKGPFLTGSPVSVYAVTSGVKGALLLQTATTDDLGSYSADLGSYSGPVIVEVSGAYRDEATGSTVSVSAAAPIRAALPAASGNVTLPVTPLTELAVQKTGGDLTPGSITAANTLVSSIFKVEITATLPVAPTAAAFAGASQAQKDYSLALATISQMASGAAGATDSDKLQTVLAALSQGISTSGMASATASSFQNALSDFVTTNTHNQTGISDTATTTLATVGKLTQTYALSLQGSAAAGTVKGVQFELALPSGVTVDLDPTDAGVLSSSLTTVNTPSGTLLVTRYAAGVVTLAMVSTTGFNSGQFATLTCNLPSTTAVPATAFGITNLKAIDVSGIDVAGISVTIN